MMDPIDLRGCSFTREMDPGQLVPKIGKAASKQPSNETHLTPIYNSPDLYKLVVNSHNFSPSVLTRTNEDVV